MAIVLIMAIALGFGIPGYHAYSGERPHVHTFVMKKSGLIISSAHCKEYGLGIADMQPSYWARYCRQLLTALGQNSGDCGERIGLMEEACARDNPDLPISSDVKFSSGEEWLLYSTLRQADEIRRLNRDFFAEMESSLPVIEERQQSP